MFCIKCGFQVDEDVKICTKCGFNISDYINPIDILLEKVNEIQNELNDIKSFFEKYREAKITYNNNLDDIKTMDEIERITINNTLLITGGSKTKTCELLGIGRSTLDRKINKYGIERIFQ